jgi:hypothetical protein
MYSKTILTIIFIGGLFTCFAQNKNEKYLVSDYPEGYYNTLEDFINKNVSPLGDITRVDLKNLNEIAANEVVEQFFFVTLPDFAKLKKVFAVSKGGNLYIRQAYFTKYASKGDRVDAAVNPNSYHKVLMDGNFLYLECVFANTWKTGVGYNMGIAGSAIANSAYQLKPIIFNFETQKFDLFRNCEDLNLFLLSRNSELKQDCDKRYLTLEQVKEILRVEIAK